MEHQIFYALLLVISFFSSSQSAIMKENSQYPAPAQNPLCACPKIYLPLCASDLRTYPSTCYYECINGYLKERGDEPLTVLAQGTCAEYFYGPDY